MTLDELARLIQQMRSAQKRYFASKDAKILTACKDYERRVDAAVAEILWPPGLFDPKEPRP